MQGSSRQKFIDYKEAFAPVVRYSAIQLLLAPSFKFKLHIHQLDVEMHILRKTFIWNSLKDIAVKPSLSTKERSLWTIKSGLEYNII